ncbi:hypothetical protein NAE78_000954 [Salmonella enterica]|nr:hypothetical protein [Salmonella enterica]ELX1499364.1 hypothetical protein [Salmonella enterica]EME9664295.1 hypothetical protein [Salmonella enterica]
MKVRAPKCEYIERTNIVNGVEICDPLWRMGNCLISMSELGDWVVTSICKNPKSLMTDDFSKACALAIYLNERA